MNNFNPLIHSFPYLLRGAGMTVLMATTAVVPATVLGVLLALLQVFGNRGMDSGTGVAFTRDPSSGENVFYGEFLVNA